MDPIKGRPWYLQKIYINLQDRIKTQPEILNNEINTVPGESSSNQMESKEDRIMLEEEQKL